MLGFASIVAGKRCCRETRSAPRGRTLAYSLLQKGPVPFRASEVCAGSEVHAGGLHGCALLVCLPDDGFHEHVLRPRVKVEEPAHNTASLHGLRSHAASGALACLGHADRKVRTMARPERRPMAGLQQKKCVTT